MRALPRASRIPIPDHAGVLAYVRVSTEEQGSGDAVSLPEQVRLCHEFAARRGRTVDAVIEDRESGRSTQRPGFQALLAFCETHPRPENARGLVICLDSSRWGRFVRRPSLATSYADRLWERGYDLEFVREPSTGTDADGFLRLAGAQAAAEESRRIGFRAHTGMLGHARAGYWQGRPPFGYRRMAVHLTTGKTRLLAPGERSAKGERVRLVPDDARTPVVRSIFERFAAGGISTRDLAQDLNARSVAGPFADYPGTAHHWTSHTVRTLLRNRAYLGELIFNRREPTPDRRKRPAAQWVTVLGAHDALVEAGTFDRVQARLTAHGDRP